MKIRIGKTTDYFLSSHTVEGYQSFFAQAMTVNRQVIALSGASAQIRSRMCRQVGIQLVDRGYNVELIHGIDNPCDLEGIAVPELGLMLADQSRIAAWNEQIYKDQEIIQVDLNQVVSPEQYPIFEAKIKDLREQIAVDLDLVYEYLNQAQKKLVTYEGGIPFSEQESSNVVERLAQSLFFGEGGQMAHRFGQSLTGEGQVNYYKSLLKNSQRKYFLNGVNYRSSCKVLADLAREAIKAGLICEVYHDFLDAELVELLIVPKLEMAISARALDSDFKELLTYKDTGCQPALTQCTQPRLEENLSKITDILREIKQLNSTVSELYQDVVNFEAIEQLERELMAKILLQTAPEV